MLKLWIGLAVAAGLGAMSGTAMAQASIPSAQGILALCDNPDQRNQSFCAGYLSSIIHVIALSPSPLAPRGLCLPQDASDITIRRVYDLVADEIRAQPEAANLSAVQVVARAMSNAYPCDGGTAPSASAPPASAPASSVPPASATAPTPPAPTPPKPAAAPKAAKAPEPRRKSDFPE